MDMQMSVPGLGSSKGIIFTRAHAITGVFSHSTLFRIIKKLPANYPKERGRTLAMGSILIDLVQAIDE